VSGTLGGSGSWTRAWRLQRAPLCLGPALRAASCGWTRAPAASLGAPGTTGGSLEPRTPGRPEASGPRDGPPGRGTLGAVSVARRGVMVADRG
jgi:hypothetical protein